MATSPLKKNTPIPLYAQLDAILRQRILSGEWGPDQMIPSENELSATYGVSRVTARSVVNQLVRDHLLYRVQGKGTFVASEKITATPLTEKSILDQLRAAGKDVETQVITFEIQEADQQTASLLQLPPRDPVYHIVRLRRLSGSPFSLHRSWLSVHRFPGLTREELEQKQLRTILQEKYALVAVRTVETLEMVSASLEESQLMEVPLGYTLLKLEATPYDPAGLVTERVEVQFKGDRIKLTFEASTPLHYS